MERLNQRRDAPNTVNKLFRLMLYCVLGFFTLLGLWFTIQYSNPVEIAVDVKLESLSLTDGSGTRTVEATLQGTCRRYRLGNEKDEFSGTLAFEGREVEIKVSFVPGDRYGVADTALGPVLMSRDGKALLLEFTEQAQLCLLHTVDNLQDMTAAIAQQEEWDKMFRWDWE